MRDQRDSKILLAVILAPTLLFAGCAADRQFDQYNVQSVADLTLSAENHPHGFTQSQCFVCHLPGNIHRIDRIKAPSFPLAASETAQFGLASCSGCHGTNGVNP